MTLLERYKLVINYTIHGGP